MDSKEQKKRLGKDGIMYYEGGGKETQSKYNHKMYHKGDGKEKQHKWYHEDGGKAYHIKSIIKNTIKRQRHEPLINLVHPEY